MFAKNINFDIKKKKKMREEEKKNQLNLTQDLLIKLLLEK